MKPASMGDAFRNAGKFRKDVEKAQMDLKNRVVEAAAGGGLVKVLVNGKQEVLKVTIEPSALASGVEMLEDLVLAAVSQGLERSKKLRSEELEKATGGLSLGLMDLL